jgi:hypothetical protein
VYSVGVENIRAVFGASVKDLWPSAQLGWFFTQSLVQDPVASG